MPAVVTESLRKEFKGGIIAVEGVSLEVQDGEVFAFLGPNGAGKTTMVRMLTTLLRPTAGRAIVLGFDLQSQPHEIRRSIGVALQEAGLDALATARELLVLQAKLCGIRGPAAAERAEEMLQVVGLTEAAERQVKTFSGGMKRRLDLASALVHRPRMLFLDEPTEGLDPASRMSVWQEVQKLNRELGMTVFLTTHYMEEADRLADQVAIIDHGRIVAEGTPASLKATIGSDVVTVQVTAETRVQAESLLTELNGLRELRLEESRMTLFVDDGTLAVSQVIRTLDSAGVRVGHVAVSQPSLDEVFLKATGSRLEGAEVSGKGDSDGTN